MRTTIRSLLYSLLLLTSSPLWADGGAVRLSQREGNYQITVLTAPTPLRAARRHQRAGPKCGKQPMVLEGRVAVTATPRIILPGLFCRRATAEAATNKLFVQPNLMREPGGGTSSLR